MKVPMGPIARRNPVSQGRCEGDRNHPASQPSSQPPSQPVSIKRYKDTELGYQVWIGLLQHPQSTPAPGLICGASPTFWRHGNAVCSHHVSWLVFDQLLLCRC